MSWGEGKPKVALLWDESFLWGVVSHKALQGAGLPFRLIRADDVRAGVLAECAALFVPGGWASNKIRALGELGVSRIRQFVREGGTYVGFCGGAGLAISDGLGLLDARRKPTSQRVPSYGGRILLRLQDDPLWQGVDDPVFHAWWPSQLAVGNGVSVLATYGEALADAFSSDVNVGDALSSGGWEELEAYYGINLDPRRMLDEPSVVRGEYGRGTVLLSLIHFDSPGDSNGAVVLRNLWKLTDGDNTLETAHQMPSRNSKISPSPLSEARPCLAHTAIEMKEAVDDLIHLGLRNFLWFEQGPLMLQWRRGVRGLEYCTLKVLMDELTNLISGPRTAQCAGPAVPPFFLAEQIAASAETQLGKIKEILLPFVGEARLLLLLERRAMEREKLTFKDAGDPRIQKMRERLFSASKSHGGLFKEVIDLLDELLYMLLTS
jgi:putative intracellular protease/amidase